MNQSSSHNQWLLKSATYLSVLIASLILFMKVYAWIITDSVTILASLIDSSLDITSSIINLLALRFSLVPPDDNHRFGHEKIQDLAVFGQGIFFMASSVLILFSAAVHMNEGIIVTNEHIGVNIMIASIIATIILISYQTYVVSVTNSNLVKADKLHYVTDLITNIAVIISIYYSKKLWFLDSLFAGLIAIYLFYGAYKIVIMAVKNLLDEEFSYEEKAKIIAVLSSYKQKGDISSIHDLKTRKAGNKHFIQFHLEMKAEMSLLQAHLISEKIEADIMEVFSEAEVIIHQDPEGIEENVSFREELNVSK